MLSGCSSGHWATAFDQICKLILKNQISEGFWIKNNENFENVF